MILKTDSAELYYEEYGQGEPLLLVHGVIVDSELYKTAAQLLSRYYRVIIYDRRGISRSKCDKSVPFSMDDQVEDVKNLLDGLNIEQTYIAGASAGAAIGAAFYRTYPDRVKYLIMFEPAVMSYIQRISPEYEKWVGEMKEIIAKRKLNNALLKFDQSIGFHDERSPEKSKEYTERTFMNFQYALTNEFPGMVDYELDLDFLKSHRDNIAVVAGERSDSSPYSMGAISLGKELGTGTLFYPGGHNMPFELPREFAISVLGTLMMV